MAHYNNHAYDFLIKDRSPVVWFRPNLGIDMSPLPELDMRKPAPMGMSMDLEFEKAMEMPCGCDFDSTENAFVEDAESPCLSWQIENWIRCLFYYRYC